MKKQIEKPLRLKFDECERLENYYSQAGQDVFVLSCLNGKQNGTFLDLGSNDAEWINNTILLERYYGWKGLSLDIDQSFASSYQSRITPFLNRDCTNLDFDEIKKHYNTTHIDYLSLDLEPASVTYECLKTIPFDVLEFSLITYEHDSYRFGEEYKTLSQDLLQSYGYKIICNNVSNGYNIYEDWYYNPKHVNYEDIKMLERSNQEWTTILFV